MKECFVDLPAVDLRPDDDEDDVVAVAFLFVVVEVPVSDRVVYVVSLRQNRDSS